MCAASDGDAYNAVCYTALETFVLSYDATEDPEFYYFQEQGEPIGFFSGETITGVLRLPPKIFSGF